MKLEPNVILENWDIFKRNIELYISSPRKEKLLSFYESLEDRIVLMPASIKREFHGAFPGGYVAHVNGVVENARMLYLLWEKQGADITTFTLEELVFSAINHDLGKVGDLRHEAYIPQTDKWRQEKLGEMYSFNKELPFASVPDRGLFLLQEAGIPYTFNEMVSIQTHDGLYDEANNKYLKGFLAETKPRSSIVYILHQADIMAARIEFEQEYKSEFNNNTQDNLDAPKGKGILKANQPAKSKALSSIKSQKLGGYLDSINDV